MDDKEKNSWMNLAVVRAAFGYFETLYYLNRNLILLCGLDIIDNDGQYEKELDDIIIDIPRLIPCKKNNGGYAISGRDGLLEFRDEISWLYDGYNTILENNIGFLEKIMKIRNKLEHKMHGVVHTGGGSSNGDGFYLTCSVMGEEIKLSDSEFVTFIKEMNALFSKLQKHIGEIACKEGVCDRAFYQRMFRYDFLNFNKIYESDLLYAFGQALFPF